MFSHLMPVLLKYLSTNKFVSKLCLLKIKAIPVFAFYLKHKIDYKLGFFFLFYTVLVFIYAYFFYFSICILIWNNWPNKFPFQWWGLKKAHRCLSTQPVFLKILCQAFLKDTHASWKLYCLQLYLLTIIPSLQLFVFMKCNIVKNNFSQWSSFWKQTH